MLVFRAVAAVGTTLRCRRMPRMPSSSSRWRMALKASSYRADVAAHSCASAGTWPPCGPPACTES